MAALVYFALWVVSIVIILAMFTGGDDDDFSGMA